MLSGKSVEPSGNISLGSKGQSRDKVAAQEPERGSVDEPDLLRQVAVLEAQLEATEDERDFLSRVFPYSRGGNISTSGFSSPRFRFDNLLRSARSRSTASKSSASAIFCEKVFSRCRQQVQTLTMAQAVMAQAQAPKAIEAEKRPRRWRWPWERKA